MVNDYFFSGRYLTFPEPPGGCQTRTAGKTSRSRHTARARERVALQGERQPKAARARPETYYSIWVPPSVRFFSASNKIQFRGAIRRGNRLSLVSRIDQTNEHHFKLMTVCLNSVLHDLDGKALGLAKVGFTFCHFRQSQRWYLDQLCRYSKTNEPIILCLHDYFVGFIYRSRERGESVNKNTPRCIDLQRTQFCFEG